MDAVKVYDTTLRDGAQREGVSFSVDDKLHITRRLDQLGIDYIEGGWPGSNPKDIEYFRRVKQLDLENATVTAFGSTRRANTPVEKDKNLQAILESGVGAVAVFGKSWDFHVTNALRTTLEENLSMIKDSVTYLKDHGLEVIYDAEHYFDGFKSNREYTIETVKTAVTAGADVIVLCDTNGGSLPGEVVQIIEDTAGEVNAPLGMHAHNDSGLGVANTLLAVETGKIGHIQGTVNGFGERCGNADLCAVIPNLQLKMGIDCLSDDALGHLTEVSRYVYELANVVPNDHQPFVGASVFAHKGGIHVSALMRHPETYEHIRPELVGNRRRVLISELAGGSNVIYKAQEYGVDLSKDSPAMQRTIDVVKKLEHQGYHFEGAEASFELILKRAMGMYSRFFDLEGFRLIIEKRDPNEDPAAEATIKVRVGDNVVHTAADGNGPVNALDSALRKALEEVYPALARIKLTDYKVRVLNEQAGTGAKVRVLIQSSDDGETWGTVGVSTNIIEASWRALVDSIEYGLLKQQDIRSD